MVETTAAPTNTLYEMVDNACYITTKRDTSTAGKIVPSHKEKVGTSKEDHSINQRYNKVIVVSAFCWLFVV